VGLIGRQAVMADGPAPRLVRWHLRLNRAPGGRRHPAATPVHILRSPPPEPYDTHGDVRIRWCRDRCRWRCLSAIVGRAFCLRRVLWRQP